MAFALGELADLLHEGKRFAEIVESKCALDAAGVIAQPPIWGPRLAAQGLIAPQRRNAAPTRRAGFFRRGVGPLLCSPPSPGRLDRRPQRVVTGFGMKFRSRRPRLHRVAHQAVVY